MRRIRAIAHKEFLHIFRDPRSLAFAILMPLMMVLLYGYAIDMDIKNLRVGILDNDHSVESADFVRKMTSSGFITEAGYLTSRDQVEEGFRRNKFHAVVVFPENYGKRLINEPTSPLQILIDGADGTSAAMVGNYLTAVTALINQEQMRKVVGDRSLPIEARPRVWFNPELVSAHFIVPGLVAIILMMICALLTSVAITREKETGTLEQMLTTPVKASQIVIGKVLPYLLIAALDAVLVLILGRYVFGVEMSGSWWVLAGYSLIYLTISLAFGLLISTIAKTQQIAMIVAMLATILPAMILSGFVFPVSSMPRILQWIAHIIPAFYFQTVIRGIMMKGEAWFPLEGSVMIVMSVFLIVLAAKRFRMRLDT
jgi:ABC-2 type transport system permease protein